MNDSESQEELIVEENIKPIIGPPKINAINFFLKILGGIIGGTIGALVIVVIFLLSSAILSPVLSSGDSEVHDLFVFVIMGMIFLGTLAANLLGSLFICLSDPEKYRRVSSSLYQIFVANLVIFFISAPVYLIVAKINTSFLAYIAGLHIIISSQASTLIQKIVTNNRYALLGVYSTVLATLGSLSITSLLYYFTGKNMSVLLFAAIPSIWFCIGFFEAIIGLIYYGLFSFYGIDFLATTTPYGSDEAEGMEVENMMPEEKEEIIIDAKKDESGEKFLSKMNK